MEQHSAEINKIVNRLIITKKFIFHTASCPDYDMNMYTFFISFFPKYSCIFSKSTTSH